MIHRGRCVAACLVGASLPAGGAFGSDRREDAAQSAAESWLKLVDGGGYAESWSQASVPVKESVKQADWAQSVGGVRGLLGKVVSHRLKSRAYSEKAGAARVIGGRVYRACRGTSFAEFHGRVIVLPDA